MMGAPSAAAKLPHKPNQTPAPRSDTTPTNRHITFTEQKARDTRAGERNAADKRRNPFL